MAFKRFTEQEKHFIRDHWQEMTDREMADRLGRKSRHGIKSYRYRMGFKKPLSGGIEWTDDEIEILETFYPIKKGKEVLDMINGASGPDKKMHHIYSKCQELAIYKDDDFRKEQLQEAGRHLAEDGKETRFKIGHTPFNKGMGQEDFMTEEMIKRTKATRFKKGRKPWNIKTDGAVTIRRSHKERGAAPYMWIRISDGDWELYHRYLYKKHIGPIEKKGMIAFKNGNTLDCRPGNLEQITMGENARRNHNPEKTAQSIKEYWKHNPHPARDLSDNYVASLLAGGDTML